MCFFLQIQINFLQRLTLINLFTIIFIMDNCAILTVHNSIETIIHRAGQTLYNKYINKKVPKQVHQNQNKVINLNMNLHFQKQPQRDNLANGSDQQAQQCSKDQMISLNIPINHNFFKINQSNQKSNQKFKKNSKLQFSLNSKYSKQKKKNNLNQQQNSIFLSQQSYKNTQNPQRPFSILSHRMQAKKSNNKQLSIGSIYQQRRASTSMNNRKKIKIQNQNSSLNLVKLQIQDEQQILKQHKKLKDYKIQNNLASLQIENREKTFSQYRMNQELRAKEKYEKLKSKLSSKLNQQVMNFQSVDGQIQINQKINKNKNPKIIQINYKNTSEIQSLTIQPQKISVNQFRNRFFRYEHNNRKKLVSNTQYNNNGTRQISSIPYVNISQGVLLSQTSGITISAMRRRSKDQVSKSQFDEREILQGFRSFNKTIDTRKVSQDAKSNESFHFSHHKSSNVKEKTNKSIQNSLLWNPKKLSQSKHIRVSNKRYFNEQILNN